MELLVMKKVAELGLTCTISEARSALQSLDEESIKERHRTRYVGEVWDKVSPINGKAAHEVITSRGITSTTEVALVYRDGAILYFQPTYPGGFGKGGSIQQGDGQAVADYLVEQMVLTDSSPDIIQAAVIAVLESQV